MSADSAQPRRSDVLIDPPVSLGDVIADRYRLEGILDSGGMGVICVARHVQLGSPVAIKFLRRQWCRDPRMVERFLEEAKAASALKSEHIVRVMDFGVLPPETPYLVMDHLDGTNLGALVEQHGPLPIAHAVEYALQACAALDTAHAAGIVHRDIKPENLFLATAGNKTVIKLVDFGIAKRVDADAKRMTGPQEQMGSPYYMSPEQIASPQGVDARTDIWSLGVVLYRLLTDEVPFDGDSVPAICARVLHATAPPLRQRRPDASAELEAVIQHCLEKDPARRYATIQDLASDLSWCREETAETFPLELRRPPKAFSTAPLSFEFDEKPSKQDLPMSGVRGRHVAAIIAIAVVVIGVFAIRQLEVRRRNMQRSYTEETMLQPTPAAPAPPVSAHSSDWSLQPKAAASPDVPSESEEEASTVETSGEPPSTQQVAQPLESVPPGPPPPQITPAPPPYGQDQQAADRIREYEEYLRKNALRPVREVLPEVEAQSPPPKPEPAPPVTRSKAPDPEPDMDIQRPQRSPRGNGKLSEDQF